MKDFEYTDEERKIVKRVIEQTGTIPLPDSSKILNRIIEKQKELEEGVLRKRKWSEPDCYYCESNINSSFDRTYIVNEITSNNGISTEKHNICNKCIDKVMDVLYK